MTRRVGLAVLITIVLSLGVLGEGGLSFLPLRLQAPATAGDNLDGIGPNGLRVDSYSRTLVAADSCDDVRIPAWVLRDRCADDDGCQVRLVSDGNIDQRSNATVRSFVIGKSLQHWSVSTSFTGRSFYENEPVTRPVG